MQQMRVDLRSCVCQMLCSGLIVTPSIIVALIAEATRSQQLQAVC